MNDDNPIVHIEDINNNLELKIFEGKTKSGISYLEFLMLSANGTTINFGLEEKDAAILFEGLCQIFENDDSEYQTDCDASVVRINSNGNGNKLDRFF